MLEWILRGLHKRRITTRYPRQPEPPPPGFRSRVDVLEPAGATGEVAAVCPTGAIAVDADGHVRLDRARCIVCGDCVRAMPQRFAYGTGYETGGRSRPALIAGAEPTGDVEPLRRTLAERPGALRRSIHVRHIDCGSDGAEEWEIQALWNPYYDIQRLGFFLTNAPRHADVLLVTGPVTAPMHEPLQRTWQVMPEPKALVAVGTDACGGGLHGDRTTTAGGVDRVLSVDVYVPGSPPAPIAIMHGLLLATGWLTTEVAA
jgi:Ni,Fe-hydrogenase III small subunit/NAD-dependent dihydropyrimidine dehydrogenase PreA subunit